MTIGEKIIKAIKLREDSEQKVQNAFKAAIKDAKLNGVEIEDIDITGDVFKAVFNGYEVRISVDEVVNELKSGEQFFLNDVGIKNAVERSIMEQLNY